MFVTVINRVTNWLLGCVIILTGFVGFPCAICAIIATLVFDCPGSSGTTTPEPHRAPFPNLVRQNMTNAAQMPYVRPPSLTERQFEVLELISYGATRSEIAKHLNISPETVKAHTKAVLTKFDAASYRDCAPTVVKFLAAYGDLSRGTNLFYDTIDFDIEITPDWAVSIYNRRQTGIVVRGQVREISTSIDFPGELFDIFLNGREPDRVEERGKYVFYAIDLPHPLKTGQDFQRHLTYKARAFTEKGRKEISNTIGTPTGILNMSVTFPAPPEFCKGSALINSKLVPIEELKNVSFRMDGLRAMMSVTQPNSGDKYTIYWSY